MHPHIVAFHGVIADSEAPHMVRILPFIPALLCAMRSLPCRSRSGERVDNRKRGLRAQPPDAASIAGAMRKLRSCQTAG